MLNLLLIFIYLFGLISGGIILVWNVLILVFRIVGMNIEIVLFVNWKLYINFLNVVLVVMCLSVIVSFSLGFNGFLKINKSKKIINY